MAFGFNDNSVIRGQYFPHIDGLRAFAVLSVLSFHAFPSWCPGGFIGVDVFFVISGYLITKGLLADLDNGEYTIGKFYMRRIRRILPAYVAMIVFTLLLCLLCYYGPQVQQFSKTALSSAFFSTNLFFWKTSDYFAPNSHDNPLLNLWSLSVEEQFYIFFPLILAALHRWCRKHLVTIIWCLAGVSFVVSTMSVLLLHQETAAFYLLHSRAWELLGGCLLAIHSRSAFYSCRWNAVLLLLLTGAFFCYNSALPFPGAAALLPIVCAVSLLATGNSGWAAPVLQHPLTVFVGKISYSLYLFHWPLLVCGHFALKNCLPEPLVSLLAVVLSFICSILCWRYIETPFRKTRREPMYYFRFAAVAIAGVSLLSMALSGLGLYQKVHSPVLVEEYWKGVSPAAPLYADPQWEWGSKKKKIASLTVLGNDDRPRYLLWGDSHAIALSPAFHEFSLRSGVNGLFVNRKHTLLHDSYSTLYPRNAEWLDAVLTWLEQHPELENIVLVNRWAARAQGFTNEDGELMRYSRRDGKTGTAPEIFKLGLTELCERLHGMGKNVIIFSSIPEQGVDVPSLMLRFGLFGHCENLNSLPYEAYQQRQTEVKAVLSALEEKKLAHVIWVDKAFYPNGQPIPLLLDNKVSMYKDDDHLSAGGASYLLHHLEQEMLNLLK